MRNMVIGLVVALFAISSGSASELGTTLTRISETGQFNIGYRVSEPPMSFEDSSGNVVGYSVDLCEAIAAAVKQKLDRPDVVVNYIGVTAENRFDKVQSGEIDILCGATTMTLSRSERVDFTYLTFATGGTLLSLKENSVANVTALKGKRVAVVDDTTTIEALRRVLSGLLIDAEIVPIASAQEGMQMLDAGDVDAFASDQVVLIGQVITRESGKEYSLSQELFSYEPFALASTYDDAEFQLLANRAISQLSRSGQIAAIYTKWFGNFSKNPPTILRALYEMNAIPE